MDVTWQTIATELGRASSSITPEQQAQWESWIDRAVATIERRAVSQGVSMDSLDQVVLDEVVTYVVARLARIPEDGAERVDEQVGIDDYSHRQSRSYRPGYGDVFVLDSWWEMLGLLPRPRLAFTIRPSGVAGYR